MFFGDEDKENSTASWDYETETESINPELNATNEKGLLDAIKDSLNYIDGNKQTTPTEQQTNGPDQTVQSIANLPSYNVSDDDNGSGDGDDADDDEDEDISLLDFFLKGESAFTPTTAKPFVFNVTGKPLLNGMTNSPMQIQPILPDNMTNDSIKFSMLPMSLYNMVKDDGTVMFDGEKPNQSPPQTISSHPLGVSDSKHAIKEIESDVSPIKAHVSTVSSDVKTTTHLPPVSVTKLSTIAATTTSTPKTSTPKTKPHNDSNVRISNQTAKVNKTESVSVKSVPDKTESTITVKATETTIKQKVSTTPKPMPTKSLAKQNVTKSTGSTAERIITTTATTIKPIVKTTTAAPKIDTSTIKTTIRTTTKTTTKATTTKAPIIESTTTSVQPLTTKSASVPKITAVQINSNPSILETDLSYDYSEPTLPPSLPNLKIIPFLPTDAVKNIIHRNDGYKPNYNYYQSNSNLYSGVETQAENTAYSPFNVKPNIEKYPTYAANVADDRIDYDSYKMPVENVDGLDYINVYAPGGNMVQPTSFQLSVNSKLDYGTDQKVIPSKIPATVNKNLTVKPPLPPFEPEHEYHLYNQPPQPIQPQIELGNGYNEYSVNGPISNDPFPSEHNYNVPHFVTMPPLKEPPHRPIANKDSVFSYGGKNKFIPPAKTEGKNRISNVFVHFENTKKRTKS